MSMEREVINSPSNNQVWLTSFGDLLTLLLSFFIAVIGLSPLNPAVKAKLTIDGNKTNSVSDENRVHQDNSGTHVAKIEEKQTSQRAFKSSLLRFARRDFVLNRDGFRRSAKWRLKKTVVLNGYAASRVLLMTCSGNPIGEPWSRSEELALLLRRQLIDAGIKSALIKMQVFGPHCQRVGGEGVEAKVSFSGF